MRFAPHCGLWHQRSAPTDADITESSIVVPKGSLQVENGLTWTDYRRYTTVDLSETLMRFGISDRTELRIVIPNYLESLTGPVSASGFFDVAPGMKHQFRPLSGEFDLSVIVALSIPAGADRISSHGYDPFIKFPWPKDLKLARQLAAWSRCSGIPKIAGTCQRRSCSRRSSRSRSRSRSWSQR